MKKNNIQFYFDSTFNFEEMLKSLEWCIYNNNCSLTQYSYLQFLFYIDSQINSLELKTNINKYINYILNSGDKINIGTDDLTRILTRFIIRYQNISIEDKLFLFIKQTRTELSFVETILLETNLSLFEK